LGSSYLAPNEQKDLKGMLYSYLKDKASRRADVTSKTAYEGAEDHFVKQKGLYDMGAFAGALDESADMIGTVGGKDAKADVIPKLNESINRSSQNAYNNFQVLRNNEERSNINDLRVADSISGMENRDFNQGIAGRQQDERESTGKLNRARLRKLLEDKKNLGPKRRLSPDLMGPDGSPTLLDDQGNPSSLTGYKMRERPENNSYKIVPGYEGDGQIMVVGKDGQPRAVNMPKGFKKTEKKNKSTMSEREKFGLAKMGELAEAQYQKAVKAGKDSGKWDPTKYSDIIDNTSMAPNFMRNNSAIEAEAAMSSWGDSYLRDESGAAIPEAERGKYYEIYFPQLGDTKAAVENKRILRQQKIINAREASNQDNQSQKVRIKDNSDGKTYLIPREKLDSALQDPNVEVLE